MNYNQLKITEERQQLNEWVWLLPALATAVRVGGPALYKLYKGGRAASKLVKPGVVNTAKVIVKNPGTTLKWAGAGYIFKSVHDVVEMVREYVGDLMDNEAIETTANLVWKYKLPAAAVIAVLYGGKKLKDYMAGDKEKESGNTTINNYYGNDQQPATESIYANNEEDQMNPEVLIQGYGRLNLNTLETKVERMFIEMAGFAKDGNWDNVEYNLNKGLVKSIIKAITDTYKELEEIRKRGGKNSRGIQKR